MKAASAEEPPGGSSSLRGRAYDDGGAASEHFGPSAARPPSAQTLRVHALSQNAEAQAHFFGGPPPQIKGLYLVRFAVSVTATYLAIQLLITFAEVLLPFIFAVLCTFILEPLKRFIARVFQRLAVLAFQMLNLDLLLENKMYVQVSEHQGDEPASSRKSGDGVELTPFVSGEDRWSTIDESATEDVVATGAKPVVGPVASVKRAILAVSILICMAVSARVIWLTAKVFLRAGYAISGNLVFYKAGADRLKRWIQLDIRQLHMETLDWGRCLDDVVAYVEEIGSMVTANVLDTVLQALVTLIFLLYMLWSPVKMESNTVTQEVFRSTGLYLKVKCLISAITGILVCITLWACGLDLPAAFGLLAFLANFLPGGTGSFVASALPCILAIIDVRKTPTQVLIAFLLQLVVHFCIDFFVEPVFFGISVEIHSVIVILGIWFFYQVWGVPGMLLSVPLLAVMRLLLKSVEKQNRIGSVGGDDADSIIFWNSVLEGRWMSHVGEQGGAEFEDEFDFTSYAPGKFESSDSPRRLPSKGLLADAPVTITCQQEDIWALLSDSKAWKDLCELYESHRLMIDVAVLVVATTLLIMIPL